MSEIGPLLALGTTKLALSKLEGTILTNLSYSASFVTLSGSNSEIYHPTRPFNVKDKNAFP
ncbi:hypothetical protein ACLM5H_10465 [Fredinandcohnia humi]